MTGKEIAIRITGDEKGLVKAIDVSKSLLYRFEKTVSGHFDKIQKSWLALGAQAAIYSTVLKNVGSAIQQFIISPLSGAVNSFVQFGDQLSKTSQRVGLSVTSLGGLKFAAEQCGSNFEEMTDAVKTFQEQLGAAKLGDEGTIRKLGDVGINPADFEGLSNEEQFLKLADHIASIKDRAEQTRTAVELFGEAGYKLLPFFQEGSAGIQKLVAEGKKIGAVLGDEAASNAVQLADAMNRMKTSFTNIQNLIAAAFAPTITSLCDTFTYFHSILSEWLKNHPGITKALGLLAAGVGGVTAAMGVLLGVIPLVSMALTALSVNPATLWITGITAGIVGVLAVTQLWSDVIRENEAALYKHSDAAAKNAAEVQKKIDADNKMIERLKELEELSQKDHLNNSEVQEANRLIETLTERYGDLGLSIDRTTGKIEGMADAQKKMLEQQRNAQKLTLEAELAEIRLNRKRTVDKYANAKVSSAYKVYEGAVHLWGGQTGHEKDQTQKMQEELDVLSAQERAVQGKLNLLAPPVEEGEEEAEEKSLDQLTRENRENRQKAEEEKDAYNKAMEPLEARRQKDMEAVGNEGKSKTVLALEKLTADYLESWGNLNNMIDLAKKHGDTSRVQELSADRTALTEKWLRDQAAIRAKEYGERLEIDEKRNALQPDARLAAAHQKVESVRDTNAAAILSGNSEEIEKTAKDLEQAELELARTIATVSGQTRKTTRQDYESRLATYDEAKAGGADNATLNELWKSIEAAKSRMEAADREYFQAVRTVESKTPAEVAVAAAAESVALASQGTFSAYGLEAVAQSNIPAETLDQIRKLVNIAELIQNNQVESGVFAI